jgi:hypothetical protein
MKHIAAFLTLAVLLLMACLPEQLGGAESGPVSDPASSELTTFLNTQLPRGCARRRSPPDADAGSPGASLDRAAEGAMTAHLVSPD